MTDRQELMMKAVQRGKYAPLFDHLNKMRGNEWATSFEEIEQILGFSLPDSAHIHRPWWANTSKRGGHSQSMAWELAGWKTGEVDLEAQTLVFRRED